MVIMVAEGVVMAIMHPGIAAGSATLAGIVLFKSNICFPCNNFIVLWCYIEWVSAVCIVLSLVPFANAQCNLVFA